MSIPPKQSGRPEKYWIIGPSRFMACKAKEQARVRGGFRAWGLRRGLDVTCRATVEDGVAGIRAYIK